MPRDSSDEPIVWPDNAVWLASYPRSGNTYLRSILWTCFGLQTGSIYANDLRGDLAVSQQAGHFEGAAHGQFSADFLRLPLIKTHGLPTDDRKAIYIVRNGRDCCRSMLEFLHAEGHRDLELDDIIAGQHEFGSWSDHFLAWAPEARPNTLFLRFEQLIGDFHETLQRLARFLEMRPLHATPPKPVAVHGPGPHWLSPGSTRSVAMTSAQEALFDRLHGHVMARLGYLAFPSRVQGRWANTEHGALTPFLLFTSIKPPADAEELSYLRDCIASWRAAGFTPVAVNGPSEVKKLQDLDVPVEFARLPKDGKPRIGAILQAVRDSSAPVAGIINSDCRMMADPLLAHRLVGRLDRTCVIAWRVDVGEGVKPAATSHGFDCYFFDTRYLPKDDRGFSIGDTWWDYWFPMACEMAGARLETLSIPVLTHRVHPLNWSQRNWEAGAERFWEALRHWKPTEPKPDSLFAALPGAWWKKKRLNAAEISSLSIITPQWFYDARPQRHAILPPEMADVESMAAMGGRALLEASDLALVQNLLNRSVPALRLMVAISRRVYTLVMRLRWHLKLRTRALGLLKMVTGKQ